MDLILSALQYKGSAAVNYCSLQSLVKDEKGRIKGAIVKDELRSETHEVRCKTIVNCSGCFSDEIRRLDDIESVDLIVAVEGTHLVLDRSLVNSNPQKGLFINSTQDGRVMFVVPWLGQLVLGTTEYKYEQPVTHPVVRFQSVAQITQGFNQLYPHLQASQIMGAVQSKWAGLRPLVKEIHQHNNKAGNTKNLSRKHVIETRESGMISLMGGKWTIQRKMGEETVDKVLEQLVKQHQMRASDVQKSITK